jgi:hypothetical protein
MSAPSVGLVELREALRQNLDVMTIHCPLMGSFTETYSTFRICDESAERVGQTDRIAGLDQQAGLAVDNDIWNRSDRRRHGRYAGGHRFQNGDGLALGI